MNRTLPRYPVYVPSRGRYESGLTAKCLIRDGVPFYLVVEPHEADEYRSRYPEAEVLVLPWSNLGVNGLIAVRNWIKDHSIENGHKRHWQLDDNIRRFFRFIHDKRLPCRAGVALRVCEDFVDRYTNIAVAGLNYDTFVRGPMPPFNVNCHVYSCSLIWNELPNRWRLPYNDDTDMCLQVLADGYCTVLFNAFMCGKSNTMTVKGGNTPIYQDDGRLKMSRMLERVWPGVVSTGRRFKRPQHVVSHAWRRFDTPLKRRDDINWEELEQQGANEYGMQLTAVGNVESKYLRGLLDED